MRTVAKCIVLPMALLACGRAPVDDPPATASESAESSDGPSETDGVEATSDAGSETGVGTDSAGATDIPSPGLPWPHGSVGDCSPPADEFPVDNGDAWVCTTPCESAADCDLIAPLGEEICIVPGARAGSACLLRCGDGFPGCPPSMTCFHLHFQLDVCV